MSAGDTGHTRGEMGAGVTNNQYMVHRITGGMVTWRHGDSQDHLGVQQLRQETTREQWPPPPGAVISTILPSAQSPPFGDHTEIRYAQCA